MNSPSHQPALFDGTQVLADGALGRITYTPDLLARAAADSAFARLLVEVPWQSERRRMYERDVDTPRLFASYVVAAAPPPIGDMAATVTAATAIAFTHVGLNLYRDAHDSVAPHNDHLDELVAGQPIALVSLGATREMVIRAKRPPRRVLRLDLAAGSLLVMSYATQLHYDHGIPKQRTPVGPRISLAFRVRAESARRRY